MRVRIARGFWSSRFGLAFLAVVGLSLVTAAGVFTFYYIRYARMVDERLTGQVFHTSSSIFTAPRRIAAGQPLSPPELAGYLQRAGYTEAEVAGARGLYRLRGGAVEIVPAATSYFRGQNALRVEFAQGRIATIRPLSGRGAMPTAELEPELLTNLFDASREKRRLVRFDDLPQIVVDAVLSAEDKRFFDHPGFDPIRVIGAAWADVRSGELAQGASTITMQVARSYFFSTERTWRRKMAETMVALQLEQRFTKDQIFELYANQVYIGNRGSFAIHGFGEAAQAYFGKDVRELHLGEAAFLAGILHAPNRYSSAERNPERAVEARDRVLGMMLDNDKITQAQADAAKELPLKIIRGTLDTTAAPNFVDMIKDHLLDKFTEAELLSRNMQIYTTLDAELQRAAAEAVEIGIAEVDKLLARRYERWQKEADARLKQGKPAEPVPQVQVALVALDPRTGEIRALIGGRDYGRSQLNRALARRQPGSVFKPFVYAAAFDNAAKGFEPVVTPLTPLLDEPTTFYFEDIEYAPNNYGLDYRGIVSAREALRHSLNVATVKVAEMIGYTRVVEMARQLALGSNIQATPAVALGAYEMTPVDVAAAYTVFANMGKRAEPVFLRAVGEGDGTAVEEQRPQLREVLDPRVAYLVTNILEDVINRGTGAAVRARGFTLPAAGKTGTANDGWFAGFTSNLLTVVWVGFDDNRDLALSGSAAAAPIWAEFMTRATAVLGRIEQPQPFVMPQGVVRVMLDAETNEWATTECPQVREEVFIVGTEPGLFCTRHGGRMVGQIPPVSWISGLIGKRPDPLPPVEGTGVPPGSPGTATLPPGSKPPGGGVTASAEQAPKAKGDAAAKDEDKKKKNVFRRIFGGMFGGKKDKDKDKDKPPPRP